jgi:L-serine dehydratase
VEVDGFPSDFSANLHPLIVDADDVKGSIAFIASVIAHDACNIATMNVSRRATNDLARHFIQVDTGLKPIALQYISQLS